MSVGGVKVKAPLFGRFAVTKMGGQLRSNVQRCAVSIMLTSNNSTRAQVAVGAFAQSECDSSWSRWIPLDISGLASSEGESLGDFERVRASSRLRKDRSREGRNG